MATDSRVSPSPTITSKNDYLRKLFKNIIVGLTFQPPVLNSFDQLYWLSFVLASFDQCTSFDQTGSMEVALSSTSQSGLVLKTLV